MSRKRRILIIEDEEPIRNGLLDLFVFHGYEVDSADDGAEGLAKARRGQYDLILLDIMLPSLDGFTVCNKIRENDRKQPVIMLTAKTSEEDIINGLTLGADDYIAKPFSVRELVLRSDAVLRRAESETETNRHLAIGTGSIDTLGLTGSFSAEEPAIAFTRREVEIIAYLLKHRDRPVSRDELLAGVWNYANPESMDTRTVDIHMAKLRKKIELDPKQPKRIVTVRGEGYRLVVE